MSATPNINAAKITGNNFSATGNPGASDDDSAGYAVGSRWIDINANKVYVCVDSTTSNAIWTELGIGLSSVLNSAQILVGNGSNVATAVSLSGDATISNTGAITIANNAITTIKIADANITTAKILDANITTAKIADANITVSKIAASNVNNSKLAVMAANTIKGAISSGNPIDLTKAQAKTILGFVEGPASSTDNAIARYDSTTGGLIQDSTVTIADTTGDITTPGDIINSTNANTKIEIGSTAINNKVNNISFTEAWSNEGAASPNTDDAWYFINKGALADFDTFIGTNDSFAYLRAYGQHDTGTFGGYIKIGGQNNSGFSLLPGQSSGGTTYEWHGASWLNLVTGDKYRSQLSFFTSEDREDDGGNQTATNNPILPGEMWFNGTNLWFHTTRTNKVDLLASGGGGGAGSALADGSIFIGNASNVAAAQTIGGEISITNTGDVEISSNIIDEDNLKVSNTPVNGYALIARSGNTGGMTWEALPGQSTGSGTKVLVKGAMGANQTVGTSIPIVEFVDSGTPAGGALDLNSEWDNTNHRFTVASSGAGTYLIQAQIFLTNGTAWSTLYLYKNGLVYSSFGGNGTDTTNTWDNLDGTIAIDLDVDDYIDIRAYSSANGTISFSNWPTRQAFSIAKIGESVTVNNVVLPSLTKTIVLEAPTDADYIPIFRTDVAITIQEALGALMGSGSVAVRLYWDTDLAAASATAIGAITTLTDETEDTIDISNDATIPADSWIFLDIGTVGTAQTTVVNIRYTE